MCPENDRNTSLEELKGSVELFNRERDWVRYHNPRDLAASVSIESAELLEIFQWKNDEELAGVGQDPEVRERVKDEVADVAIYLFAMCTRMDIDLSTAIREKLKRNEKRFPVTGDGAHK